MITLENVIDGRIYDGTNSARWRDMTDDERMTYGNAFRTFLLKGTHKGGKTRRMLSNLQFSTCQSFGIYRRLMIDLIPAFFENGKDYTGHVEYCAGQDYPSELAYIKKLLCK